MRTKDFILLGAGYAAGRLSKKINAGPIGAIKKKPVIFCASEKTKPKQTKRK